MPASAERMRVGRIHQLGTLPMSSIGSGVSVLAYFRITVPSASTISSVTGRRAGGASQ